MNQPNLIYTLISGLEMCPIVYEHNPKLDMNGHKLPCVYCQMQYIHLNIFNIEFTGQGKYYVCEYAIKKLKKHLEFFTDLYNRNESSIPPQYTIVEENDQQDENRLICPICIGFVTTSNKSYTNSCDQSGDQIIITPCFHCFHASCLNRWIEDTVGDKYKTCPICRGDTLRDPDKFTVIEINKSSSQLENTINKLTSGKGC